MKHIYFTIFAIFLGLSLSAQIYPDRHTTSPSDGWKSCQESISPNLDIGMSHWVLFDFQSVYQLTNVKMWNLNDPLNQTDGLNAFRVDYSLDKVNWVEQGTYTISGSDGSAFYQGQDVFDFGGVDARYVLITAVSNLGGTCYGFDEIRFYLGAVVPVELADFNVDCIDSERKLTWEYADVSDFGSISVESSQNGRTWSSIYNSSELGKLQDNGVYRNEYIDVTAETSKSQFYRLKIYDLNGDFQYSEVLEANCVLDDRNIELYPNPVQADLTIDLELPAQNLVSFEIRDLLGSSVSQGEFNAFKGNNRQVINTKTLVPGSYVLRLKLGEEILEKKFIKINW